MCVIEIFVYFENWLVMMEMGCFLDLFCNFENIFLYIYCYIVNLVILVLVISIRICFFLLVFEWRESKIRD